MRLIDADDLLVDNTWTWFDEWGNCTPVGKIIMDAPTIDAVPVVRCKDCEHWDEEDHGCNIRDSYGWDYKPDDFCSYGERREP